MEFLLAPPIAFVVYLALVAVLSGFGRILAGKSQASELKSSAYTSGETPLLGHALPGYRGFFIMALFFAVLHLGVLMIGSSGLAPMAGAYLVVLITALIVLILG
jgi:NADH:ubiquinone oxidoreductase subunit 3 (subunit A)